MRKPILLLVALLAFFAGLAALAIEARSADRVARTTVESTPVTTRSLASAERPALSTAPTTTPSTRVAMSPTREGDAATEPAVRPAPDRRDELARRLRASGPASAALKTRTEAVTGKWMAAAAPELARRVRFGATECHAGGCIVEATYADALSVELVDESLTASDAFLDFPGWRHRAPPTENADGTVTTTWFFLAE